MKNNRRSDEIRREYFDSLFLWKAFYKLIKKETPFVFLLKIFIVAAFFVLLILFIALPGTSPGN